MSGRLPAAGIDRRVELAFAVAVVLATASKAVSGDWAWWWWPASELIAAFAFVRLSHFAWFRRWSRRALVAVAVGLPLFLFAVRLRAFPGLPYYTGARTGLWFGNPIPLAGSIAALGIAGVLAAEPAWWPAALLFPLAFLATASLQVRGSVVAVVVASVVWTFTRPRGRRRLAVIVVFVVLTGLIAGFLATYTPSRARGPVLSRSTVLRFTRLDRYLGDIEGRLSAQSAAVGFFARAPIGGQGNGSYPELWRRYVDPGADHPLQNAHNLFLQLLVEGGLLGFAAWAVAIGGTLWWARSRLLFLAPLLAAVLWLNLIEYAFFWSGMFLAYWLAVGWALYEPRRPAEDGADNPAEHAAEHAS